MGPGRRFQYIFLRIFLFILILPTLIFSGCSLGVGTPILFGQASPTPSPSPSYVWNPVKIGAGGCVLGMVIHPLDLSIRYARTDVGNIYSWNSLTKTWKPLRLYNSDGSGVGGPDPSSPGDYGESSIAVDPNNPSIIYTTFTTSHSSAVDTSGTDYVQIYKSVDRGVNFTPGNLQALALNSSSDNSGTNHLGERLMVDPLNSKVLYYGSESQGLYRSTEERIG